MFLTHQTVKMEEFVIDTEGRCFFCVTPHSDLPHSLQYLSLYLKMNKRKVFDEEGHAPPDLLAKVDRSRLTASLCDECALLNDQFSKLYRRLEMTELKITSCLDLIHLKLLKAEGRAGNFCKYDQPESGRPIGKQRIVQVLRTEAAQKCSQKLNEAKPKIKVRNLRKKDVLRKKEKLQQDSLGCKAKGSLNTTGKQDCYDEPVSYAVSELKMAIDHVEVPPHSSKSTPNYDDDYEDDSADFTSNNAFNETNDVDEGETKPWQRDHLRMGALETNNDTTVEKDEQGLPTPFSTELATKDRMSFREKFSKSGTGKHVCKDCSREFSSYQAFHFHYRAEHCKIRYQCKLCEQIFVHKHHYNRHQRNVHMGVRLKCAVCNKTFTRNEHLKRHQRVHVANS